MLSGSTGSEWFRERLSQLPFHVGKQDARIAVLERSPLPSGSMPPLHAHPQDESYHVLSGAVTFYIGGETVRAGAGDVVVAPAGVPRTFRVSSETASWLILTSVRSVARYEDFLRAVARGWNLDEARGGVWPDEDEAAAVGMLAALNGIEVMGPPGMLPCDLNTAMCS